MNHLDRCFGSRYMALDVDVDGKSTSLGLRQLILWLAAVLMNFVLDGAMGLADELEAELIRSGTQKGLGVHGWQSSINASCS
ncbi:unnamed protein product, partial [Mesorhabditis belari]